MLGCKALLSAISVAAVFLMVIYLNSLVSISLCSYAFKTKDTTQLLMMKSSSALIPLRSTLEEVIGDEADDDSPDRDPPVPPSNLTVEERIAWFRSKLPEFDIFKSNNMTRQFHGRVVEFFNQECEVRLFVTWISSVGSFGRRELLFLESLVSNNPGGCLVIISRSMDSGRGYRILKPLLGRGLKVMAVTPDLPSLLSKTPAEAWFREMKSGNKDPGAIPLAQNLSNLIRLAVLYEYGGVYLDTDFIVLKRLAGLRNAIGAQSVETGRSKWSRLNNAALAFDAGHPLVFKFMEEFGSTYDGNKWGHNGPYLVSRVAAKVEGREGYNFTVLPPMAFYPVIWTKMGGLFNKPATRAGTRWMEAKLAQMRGETYGVHLWNKATRHLPIQQGSIIATLIQHHCQSSYTSSSSS